MASEGGGLDVHDREVGGGGQDYAIGHAVEGGEACNAASAPVFTAPEHPSSPYKDAEAGVGEAVHQEQFDGHAVCMDA